MKKIPFFFLTSVFVFLIIYSCKKDVTVIQPTNNSGVCNYENIENRFYLPHSPAFQPDM